MSPDVIRRAGLCATCRHARSIRSAKGSEFWLCQRSTSEPARFAKYPRLPMLRCAGAEPITTATTENQ
jgi:hypothetical protein